ncbi:hypothetical protein MBLNU457_g2510t1 [Dothideomycetes sp. NU457]
MHTTSSKIYGAGLNAHGQIDKRIKSDCYTFTPLWREDLDTSSDATVLFTGWSEIAVVKGTVLHLLGTNDCCHTVSGGFSAVFGDHNGILGSLNDEGCIAIAYQPGGSGTKRLIECETEERFTHVTVAGNGHVAAVLQDDETVIHEFTSWNAFAAYLQPPIRDQGGNEPQDHTTHSLPHKITQLISSTASFCALSSDGKVYTWGDNRYGTLTRPGPTSSPQPVEHLSDPSSPFSSSDDNSPKITKIVAGGWLFGALRSDGVAFLWGGPMPGTSHPPSQSLPSDDGEGGYIETTIEIVDEDTGVLDVLDMAIGEDFVLVVVEGGRLFGVGENGNGQLGEGRRRGFYAGWVEIEVVGRGVEGVWAGPKTGYVCMRE